MHMNPFWTLVVKVRDLGYQILMKENSKESAELEYKWKFFWYYFRLLPYNYFYNFSKYFRDF
jgi:hypothetical protein